MEAVEYTRKINEITEIFSNIALVFSENLVNINIPKWYINKQTRLNYMTKAKWRNIDKKSRTLVRKLLRSIGATTILDSCGNCSYDLKCSIKGKVILVEIKDRNFPHDRYGDVFCEEDKKTCNNRRIMNGEA